MNSSLFKKTAIAAAVAGACAATLPAQANVLNVSWDGAFTMVSPKAGGGGPVKNSPSDYAGGYYANGDGAATSGAPFFPGNVGPGADCATYAPACVTAYGWYGNRTPVSGTMSFDTSTGAGVATVNTFMFFGDAPGSGPNTSPAAALGVTFQVIDTVGTMVGSMLFSWNGLGHNVSIVLDASGMFSSLPAGPTSVISGVGALPATNGMDFDSAAKGIQSLPLGPSPAATKTLNTGSGCDGLTLATQVNAYTINTNMPNVGTCTTGMVDDGVGGDPMTSPAFSGFNANFDILSMHLDSFETPTPSEVPVPTAVWLLGSGLAGLAVTARRKRKA